MWNIRRLESILTEEMAEQIPGEKKHNLFISAFFQPWMCPAFKDAMRQMRSNITVPTTMYCIKCF